MEQTCTSESMMVFVSTARGLATSTARLHFLMLFLFLFENFGSTQTAFLRQMANITHDLPHFVVFENSFPRWHSGWINSIHDNPMQLPIAITLNVFGFEVGHWGRHLLSKRYS